MIFQSVFDAIETPPVLGYSTAVAGMVSEDLFLYPVENLTLKRGETAWLPLFTAEMSYKHIYTWKIRDSYDLVKFRGELNLSSRIDKPVQVEISKELSGQILEKLPAAKDVKTAKGLKQVIPNHALTWEIKLKPGAEQRLTYLYQVYIRD